ncbi:hypothetical protein FH589_02000 (plasmid) [Leptospira interrogans]|uniref:hypothetical protein n=1 Tax=Leptospira interrogans TaxID=173 RepID=UPI001EF0E673|nr:hypothetical protein [Leptospira interrogans]ULG82578.1 hypothetical protein FH595_19620 [Leptospira interrogans]ULG82585.1 hypothetical protein FH595_19370 [Leptospira interrogans]UML67416.1 hypothetical protein FH589_02055 [Leptospira interrogans]UML67452.1 hypothetical protein FH589_02000 [Leptospira interrogans]UML82834.1 hypothetical protein FH587_02825 [Leptospira interrogans]
MNVILKYLIIYLTFLPFLNILSCSDVNINGYGVDSKDIVTRGQFKTGALQAYSLKYESCGYTVDTIGIDPILFSLWLSTDDASTTLDYSIDRADFWTNSEFREYYYKDDMDNCTRSVLSVPCQPTSEDQAKALALSFLKDCRPERASFRDKGQGNY